MYNDHNSIDYIDYYNAYLDYIEDLSQKGYDKLSIACAYKAADGLILATDSRITTREHGLNAIETDDGRKYYYSDKYNIGVACVGNMNIQNDFWLDHVIRIENESNDRDDFFRKFQETTKIIYPITQFIIIDPLNDSILYSDKVSKGLEKLNGYFYYIGQNELIQPHCTIKSIEPEMCIDAAIKRIIDLMMKAMITGQLFQKYFKVYNSVGGDIRILALKDTGKYLELSIPFNVNI